jgi:hypothetical protein
LGCGGAGCTGWLPGVRRGLGGRLRGGVVQGGGAVAVGGLGAETGDVGVAQQRGEHGGTRGRGVAGQ